MKFRTYFWEEHSQPLGRACMSSPSLGGGGGGGGFFSQEGGPWSPTDKHNLITVTLYIK